MTSTPVRSRYSSARRCEPTAEQADLRVGRAFLWSVDRRCIEEGSRHIARDGDVGAGQRPPQALSGREAAVGRRTPSDADDHLRRSAAQHRGDQLTRPAGRRSQRVVLRNEREAARSRHLDDRGAVGQHDVLGLDRFPERTSDPSRATRSATGGEERIERAFTTVSQGDFSHLVETRGTDTARDRTRSLGRSQRAPKLVRTRNGHRHGG